MCFDDFRIITILSDFQIKRFDDDMFVRITFRFDFNCHEILSRTSSYEIYDNSFDIERLKMIFDFKFSKIVVFETIQKFDVNQNFDEMIFHFDRNMSIKEINVNMKWLSCLLCFMHFFIVKIYEQLCSDDESKCVNCLIFSKWRSYDLFRNKQWNKINKKMYWYVYRK